MGGDRTDTSEQAPLLRQKQEADVCNEVQGSSTAELKEGYKITRTAALVGLYIALGFSREMSGPIMPELAVQTSSDYTTISQALALRGIGHAAGGVSGGLVVDRFYSHIDLITFFVVGGYTFVTLITAYIQNSDLLYGVFFLQGTLETYIVIIVMRINLKTWKSKAASTTFLIQFGSASANIVLPLMMGPFLDPRFSKGTVTSKFKSNCPDAAPHNSSSNTTVITPFYPARFVIPFWIVAAYSLVIAAIFLSFHIYGRQAGLSEQSQTTTRNRSYKELISLRSCSENHHRLAGLLLLVITIYYTASIPVLRAFDKYIYSYARDGPCLSVQKSVTMETTYFIGVTVGRMVAVGSSAFIHMKYILQIQVVGNLISFVLMMVFHQHITALWILMFSIGLFSGPLVPTMYAWTNRYIEFTSIAQMFPHVGGAIGDGVVLLLIGNSYDNSGPYVIWPYMIGLAVLLLAVSVVMQICGSLIGDRFHS